MEDNYPLGAKDDPSAPYNDKRDGLWVDCEVAVTLVKICKVRVDNYCEDVSVEYSDGEFTREPIYCYSLDDLDEAVNNQVDLPVCDGWKVDSIDVNEL